MGSLSGEARFGRFLKYKTWQVSKMAGNSHQRLGFFESEMKTLDILVRKLASYISDKIVWSTLDTCLRSWCNFSVTESTWGVVLEIEIELLVGWFLVVFECQNRSLNREYRLCQIGNRSRTDLQNNRTDRFGSVLQVRPVFCTVLLSIPPEFGKGDYIVTLHNDLHTPTFLVTSSPQPLLTISPLNSITTNWGCPP